MRTYVAIDSDGGILTEKEQCEIAVALSLSALAKEKDQSDFSHDGECVADFISLNHAQSVQRHAKDDIILGLTREKRAVRVQTVPSTKHSPNTPEMINAEIQNNFNDDGSRVPIENSSLENQVDSVDGKDEKSMIHSRTASHMNALNCDSMNMNDAKTKQTACVQSVPRNQCYMNENQFAKMPSKEDSARLSWDPEKPEENSLDKVVLKKRRDARVQSNDHVKAHGAHSSRRF